MNEGSKGQPKSGSAVHEARGSPEEKAEVEWGKPTVRSHCTSPAAVLASPPTAQGGHSLMERRRSEREGCGRTAAAVRVTRGRREKLAAVRTNLLPGNRAHFSARYLCLSFVLCALLSLLRRPLSLAARLHVFGQQVRLLGDERLGDALHRCGLGVEQGGHDVKKGVKKNGGVDSCCDSRQQ